MGEDVEVRREDQEKINKFSRLHQQAASLEERLRVKQVGGVLSFTLQLGKCV
jgi:hypothetical protein